MTAAATREDRIARARAALSSAELRTGARTGARVGHRQGMTWAGREAQAGREVQPLHGTRTGYGAETGPGVRETGPGVRGIETGRASAGAGVVGRASGVTRGSVLLTDRPPLTVPPALEPLLPGGLRRGSTTAVLGSTSLVLAMIAAACTAREAWAAVVGQPSLGLLAAAQSGVALGRLAVVPQPGAEGPTVVAALLDGIDVVVVGPGCALTDADRRRLTARARDRGSVLLSTAPWPGAGCVLTVEGGRWSGVGEGDGRLRAHELHVIRTGRGSAGRAQDLQVVLPLEGTTDPYGLPVHERPAVPLRLVG